tara:strand:+ start:474 stop:686 length:213 start_codon:yes stop_codon:yes gene_type:complete
MKPTNKSSEIDSFITSIMGKDRVQTIREGDCMTCNNERIEDNFRDEGSEREYQISGMCQECQDNVFGGNK